MSLIPINTWDKNYQANRRFLSGRSPEASVISKQISNFSFPIKVSDATFEGGTVLFLKNTLKVAFKKNTASSGPWKPLIYSDQRIHLTEEIMLSTQVLEPVRALLDKYYPATGQFLNFEGVATIDTAVEIQNDMPIEGNSFNLALAVYLLLGHGEIPFKGNIALTGVLKRENDQFVVSEVEDIHEKLIAVLTFDIGTFFIPQANHEEVIHKCKKILGKNGKKGPVVTIDKGDGSQLRVIPISRPEDVLVFLIGQQWHSLPEFRRVFDLKYKYQQHVLQSDLVKIRNILWEGDHAYSDMAKYVKIRLVDQEEVKKREREASSEQIPGSPDHKDFHIEKKKKVEPVLPIEVVKKVGSSREKTKPVIIFGEAGAGKSTILRKLLEQLCREEIEEASGLLPLFIELGGLSAGSDERKEDFTVEDLADFFLHHKGACTIDNPNVFKEFIVLMHQQGSVIFLLDAHDELLMSKHNDDNNLKDGLKKIIVTSRYSNALGFGESYEVMPLDKNSIQEFSENYLEGSVNKTEALNYIKGPDSGVPRHEFQNPLMLSLIVFLLKYRFSALGTDILSKTRLLAEAAELLVDKKLTQERHYDLSDPTGYSSLQLADLLYRRAAHESFYVKNIDQKMLRSTIRPLVLAHNPGETSNARLRNWVSSIIDILTTNTGMLERFGKEQFRFFHRVFHEFFVAKYVVDEISNDREKFVEWINEHKFDLRYENVFRYIAGLLDMEAKEKCPDDSPRLRKNIVEPELEVAASPQ